MYGSDIFTSFLRWHLQRGEDSPPDEVCVTTTLELLDPDVTRQCLYMGYTEQMTIRELDVDAVRRHASKMRFYYGTSDGWCPLSFYERLKASVPELDAVVCSRGFEHAFVLKSSKDKGNIIAEWMRNDGQLS